MHLFITTVQLAAMPTTFFLLAGEASGDMHAARLIRSLKEKSPDARFIGMGGPQMAAAGMELAKDLDGMQVVGFWEVAKKYGFFREVFYKLLDRVKQEKPAALICIDYPGFNLRFAKEVKKLGIPVLYYIVPQVWAWKENRAAKMAKFVDRAFCVFEFEVPFFAQYGLKTTFVGHPLMDCGLGNADCGLKRDAERKTVSFLPGSREGEIRAHMNPMSQGFVQIKKSNPQLRGLMSFPNGVIEGQLFEDIVLVSGSGGEGQVVVDSTRSEHQVVRSSHSYALPSVSDFSVVKSGTSTLEAGLAGNPLCVVYKGSAISYAIAHMLVNIPVFSLINIVLGRYVVPELLQSDVNPQRIAAEIDRGLNDERYREKQKAALAELPKKLGGPGASSRAAQGILDFLAGRA
jgi:lipid-A-disaccharide synthase